MKKTGCLLDGTHFNINYKYDEKIEIRNISKEDISMFNTVIEELDLLFPLVDIELVFNTEYYYHYVQYTCEKYSKYNIDYESYKTYDFEGICRTFIESKGIVYE